MSNIYSFSPGICPNWQAGLMSKLDSLCCFGGETATRIFSMTPSGFSLATEEKVHISTAEKVIKILALIFFPIILIALAIRYLLHRKFDRKCFVIPGDMTKEQELILAANPQLVEKAALEVCPSFFALPKKYQSITIETPAGQPPKITLSTNIDLLLQDLDIDSIPWFKLHLEPGDRDVLPRVIELEKNNPNKEFCLESKKILARYLLEQLFVYSTENTHSPNTPNGGRDTFLFGYSSETKKPSIWGRVYFYQSPYGREEIAADFQRGGCEIHNRLLKLGLKYRPQEGMDNNDRRGGPYVGMSFRINWEASYQSVLKDYGFIKDN